MKMRFTVKFFVDNILPDIVAAKPACDSYRQLVLQMYYASQRQTVLTPQKLEEKRILSSPNPAFSPTFTPSNFFLFDTLKGQLADHIFESTGELVEEIYETMSAVPRAKLETVFLEWKKRLQRCLDISGAYIGESAT
jgi:hypothetical protein